MKMLGKYYDYLIDLENDPVYDKPILQNYMNKWDGIEFIKELQLSKNKSVLEIGVGTGRIAIKIVMFVGKFTGIDISNKTIERCRFNLASYDNIELIHGDFIEYEFKNTYDIIYSSLSFLHIKEKQKCINKVYNLLHDDGLFVLSIDKSQDKFICFNELKIETFPDNLDDINEYLKKSGMYITKTIEKEFAYIIVSKKMSTND